MVDAMVNDGDIVVMKPAQDARNGDMVAVWLRDRQEVTLKRFFQDGKRVRLQPENPAMEPIFVVNPEQRAILDTGGVGDQACRIGLDLGRGV